MTGLIKIKDLIVITGPTASGKTALSVRLAADIGAEIVNADSMQIYKYMDIGTAKPTVEERRGIAHHLIDIAEPSEPFSAALYCKMAAEAIDKIHSYKKPAVMVGGTGLYIDSVVNNIRFSQTEPDAEYRAELEKIADEKGNGFIYEQLEKIDIKSAQKINVSDRKRIIRALEVYKQTGKPMSWHVERSRCVPSPYNTFMFAIDVDRDELYERINRRVDAMMEAGLVEEVENLLKMGVSKNSTSMQAIGYKEIVCYLDGKITLSEAVEKIKTGSRRYAKRQLTWFRRNERIHWIKSLDEVLKILS